MAIRFTDDQKRVIDIRNKNVLVSAAAGSGKTAVLVERICSLVCDEGSGIDIDELLVVTFTKAAAAEMRERVCRRISEMLAENPGSEHLQKQYALVHRAMITTIDSFCQNVLRNHFREIGFDPDFRVMDEGEKELLRRDVLAEYLEEKYDEGDEDFLRAARFFSPNKVNDSEFEEIILDLQNFSESFAWPEKFLKERKNDHVNTYEKLIDAGVKGGEYEGSAIGIFFLRYLRGITDGFIADYGYALSLCDKEPGPKAYIEKLTEEKESLESVRRNESAVGICEELRKFLNNIGSLPRYSPYKKKEGETPTKEELEKEAFKSEVKGIRDKIKDTVKKITSDILDPSLKENAAVSDSCAPFMNTLIDTVIGFRKRFQEKKAEKHIVDFSDLEHFALDILIDPEGNPTAAALEYRQHFKEIMVDEYQDSNLVQDVLLNAIASKDPKSYDRFMVGDVKQSIYAFRQARPDLFLEKYESYPVSEGCERIDLSRNFRSRSEVLESVNEIFEKIMHTETGKIEYDESARLNIGAEYPIDGENPDAFKTELILLDSKLAEEINGSRAFSEGDSADEGEDEEDKKDDDDYSDEETESLVLANTVRRLLSSKVTETVKTEGGEIKRLRPARYSDIVILHRSPAKLAEVLGKIFEEEGIPISINQGGGYFSAPEIRCVLQLIRTINNPLSEIPLYGTLISVFGGFSAHDIADLRAKYPDEVLWEAVKKEYPGFAEKINRYRKYSTYRSIRELLQIIFDEADYLEYISALPAGARRKANAEMLLNYASDFEKTSYYGLFHFIRYIDQLQKYTTDNTSEADVLGENADVVRLMSIHKSKGLEFPITIIAGMGKQFNFSDTRGKLVHDNEIGLGCDHTDLVKKTKTKTLRKRLIAKKITEDTLAEEMRLLYVAMTRAKEKLIMVGRVSDAEKKADKAKESPCNELSYGKFIGAKCFLDLILPVVGGCESIYFPKPVSSDEIESEKQEEQLGLYGHRTMLSLSEVKADSTELASLEERFAYKYPFEALSELYTKTTVSELKMAAMLDEDEAAFNRFENRETEKYIPEFRREKRGISGTVRGNAYHRVMEIMDFDRTIGKVCGGVCGTYEEYEKKLSGDSEGLRSYTEEFLEEARKELRISQEMYEAVNISKIVGFLKSRLAYRMWVSSAHFMAGGGLFREQPFVLSISAERLNTKFPADEKVIIQGIIDAYFKENGSIVLLDYKTDSVETSDELVKRYAAQLDYYQEAIESLTGLTVSERILYSFHLGEEVIC